MMSDSRKQDITVQFGAVVRKTRTKLGISQEELAHRSGLHRTYISGVERGQRNVSIRNIEKIADALGIAIQDLFKDL